MPNYALEGPKWGSNTITWSLAQANYSGQPDPFGSFFSSGPFLTEIRQAFAQWSSVANINFVEASDSSSVDIRLGLASLDGPYGTLGITSYYYSNGIVTQTFLPDAVVRFDSNESYSFFNGEERLSNGVTFESVALHEIGHALGLDHYTGGPAIMNPSASPSITSLTASDIAGIRALYGAATTTASVAGQHSDFNADGFDDLLFQNVDGTPAIWTISGSNIAAAGSPAGNPGPSWHEIGVGDFDGDGRGDILWQNDSGQNAVWTINGLNRTGALSIGGNPGADWHVKAAGDFDGNGIADILWQNTNGMGAIWTTQGLAPAQQAAIGNPGPSWHIITAADFDGDGKSDILWQNDNGQAAIWTMDGTLQKAAAAIGANPGSSWHVKDAGDFNGDGHADILWQNDNGTVAIWTMNGFSVTSQGSPEINPGPAWHVKSAGDYSGDGKDDIAFQNDDGSVAIWNMDGTHIADAHTLGIHPGADWHLV